MNDLEDWTVVSPGELRKCRSSLRFFNGELEPGSLFIVTRMSADSAIVWIFCKHGHCATGKTSVIFDTEKFDAL